MFNKIKFAAILLFIGLLSVDVYAQVPQGFNFQAIARGSDGLPLINQELSVRISVLEGSETGTATYVETHTLTTNTAGLLQLIIGQGTPVESSFGDINWSGFDNYVKLEIDPAGGTEFEELGTSRLLSVPYAILAENVVNGGGVGGDFPLEINLNTANADSSLIINIDGDKTAKPLQVFSRSTGFNGAIWGEAISESSNPNNQRGTYGFANGSGTGQHVGLFGGAVNFDATGGSRTGAYGQAASKAKFNYGVRGLVQGDGSGDLVAVGDEVDGDFGSYNIGGGFYSSGNLNGNVGVEGIASGDDGSRINFGVIGLSRSTAEAFNVGVRGEAFGSQSSNTALDGEASGEGAKNLGLRLNVNNGTSNIGMEVNADTAAILNGDVIINGALVHNGSSSGGGSGAVTKYDFNTSNPDSAFEINVAGPNNATGLISTATSDGVNAGLEGHSDSGSGNDNLQVGTYGEAAGEGTGTHAGVYGVATGPESGAGDVGRRYGLYGSARSTGRENIGGFGIGRGAGDGEIVALGDEFAGGGFNVGGFNIGLAGFARDNVNGNIGIRGYVFGTEGGRENRGVSGEAVATGTGRNIGAQTITHSSQSDNIGFHALMFDDGSGNASVNNYGTRLEVNNQASGENIGLWATVDGVAPNNTGIKLNVNNGTNDNIGLIVNAATAAELNGNVIVSGDLTVNGSINGNNSGLQNFFDIVNTSDDTVASIYAEGVDQQFGGGIFLKGPTTPNFQVGGKNADNGDLPFLKMSGQDPNNENIYMDVFEGGDGVQRGNITLKGSDGEEFGMNANGIYGSQDINWDKKINISGESASDELFSLSGGGMTGGTNPYTDGFVLNHDASGGPLLEMFVGGSKTVDINGTSGSITVTSLTETSDRRLKINIQPLQNALDNTLKLRGVRYNWADANKSTKNQIGVIAQEVETLYPEFVHTDDEGMKSVNYSQMVAVLIEAVKELNTKIENLESENLTLRTQVGEIERMKSQLNIIMNMLDTQKLTSDEIISED